MIEQILAHPESRGALFNVNIPSLENGPIRGIRTVPQNIAPFVESYDRRIDPRGRVYFWGNPEFHCPAPLPDSDVSALADGYVTVTPLQFNMTHFEQLERFKQWKWE